MNGGYDCERLKPLWLEGPILGSKVRISAGFFMGVNKQVLMAGVLLSLIALGPWPIGFYTFSRIVLCLCCAYAAFFLYNKENSLWLLGAGFAALYNPIIPVYLHSKVLWSVINIATAVFLFSLLSQAKNDD